MRSAHPRAGVEQHARRLLDSLDPDLREGLSVDPITIITSRLEVAVQLRPERSGTGDCPIDGSYFPDPPQISVAESLSRRRVNFSVLHELGHHLQASDILLADILWREPDGGIGLEEDVSDTFAAEVLLPQRLVDEIIDDAGPTAAAVAELFGATQASREACCVRASHRVRGPGYVVLADPDGTIRFAAPANQRYRIAPGTQQGRTHLLARAGRMGQARGESSLAYWHGSRTPAYQANAVCRDGYVFAVFVAGRPSWSNLSSLASDRPEGVHTVCPSCDEEFEAFGPPCAACSVHRCQRCGKCGCLSPVKQMQCVGCMLTKAITQFAPGERQCNDCQA
ncbi:MAG: ImmA/IrrE family metallo-endopeptidase [Egibacteraceae bacterium]